MDLPAAEVALLQIHQIEVEGAVRSGAVVLHGMEQSLVIQLHNHVSGTGRMDWVLGRLVGIIVIISVMMATYCYIKHCRTSSLYQTSWHIIIIKSDIAAFITKFISLVQVVPGPV